MSEELKPCPFCGGTAISIVHIAAGDCNVSCKCGATLFVAGKPAFKRDRSCRYVTGDYVKAWNCREAENAQLYAEFQHVAAINAIHELLNNGALSELYQLKKLITEYLSKCEKSGHEKNKGSNE